MVLMNNKYHWDVIRVFAVLYKVSVSFRDAYWSTVLTAENI